MPKYQILNKKETEQGVFIDVILCTDDEKCEQQTHVVFKGQEEEKVLSAAAWAWQDSQPKEVVEVEEKEVSPFVEALSKELLKETPKEPVEESLI